MGSESSRKVSTRWSAAGKPAASCSSAAAERFARAEGVGIAVCCEPIETASLTGTYDVVLMNGCLHYVRDKDSVLIRAAAASAADAVHAVHAVHAVRAVQHRNPGPRRARGHPGVP